MIFNKIFQKFLSTKTKKQGEKIILIIAIISYLSHLFLILLNNYGALEIQSTFLENPVAAIYTPFSFILVYEVYLLIFYLPQSISLYIGKQYEIITLIVIRRIFKDIANLELNVEWFHNQSDLQFTYDIVTSLVLFFLIFLFYKHITKRQKNRTDKTPTDESKIQKFIHFKKIIATLMVPVLFIFAIYTGFDWGIAVIRDYKNGIAAFKDINNIFFDEFFTALIIIDVLLLLSSFFYSDTFHKIMRNSGFVISTILIKISFSSEGLINNTLIIGAVSFGFVILIIHNLFEKWKEESVKVE